MPENCPTCGGQKELPLGSTDADGFAPCWCVVKALEAENAALKVVAEEAAWLRELQETEWFTLENFPKEAWEGAHQWGFMIWHWSGRRALASIIHEAQKRLDEALEACP
jgi:hypothetical protein